MKKRLDLLLVERGLAESRAQAQALVMAGRVPGHSKPGEQVADDIPLEVDAPPPYVSRAGHKLANALDVGYGQLHSKIRDDPRVVVLERVNARSLTELPFAPQLVTCDVSFISVKLALPPALALAAPGWQALVLVKPQFEAGRAETPKGVVRDSDVQRRVVTEVAEALLASGGEPRGVIDSGLPGPKGNHEFVLHLVHREHPERPADLDRWIADAVG
jgi:23S rRNA (cytidine1920-2'-O)/16S rRNA (cytidine1409-2'-O)-methyltransferase